MITIRGGGCFSWSASVAGSSITFNGRTSSATGRSSPSSGCGGDRLEPDLMPGGPNSRRDRDWCTEKGFLFFEPQPLTRQGWNRLGLLPTISCRDYAAQEESGI